MRLLFAFLAIASVSLSSTASAVELTPVGVGPYSVASTNLEVEPPGGVPMMEYLVGKRSADGATYITSILSDPAAVHVIDVSAPADSTLGALAGTRVPHVLTILYPTTHDNPRSDYIFPYKETGDNVFPRMHRTGDKPVFAATGAKYPLIVYSGGYNTHTLWHLSHLKLLVSHGYIVVDILHGDSRGPGMDGNRLLRTSAVSAAIDHVLAHPDFGPAIDADRIGVSGASAGGHTIMAKLGGINPAAPRVAAADPRIKAAFAVVPFFGGEFGVWPFKTDMWVFGKDYSGLRDVTRPFCAVYGENDTSCPPDGVEAAMRATGGPAFAVKLAGEKHLLSGPAHSDVHTWELLFFDAFVRGSPDAKARLAAAASAAGGVDDRLAIRRNWGA